MSDKLKHGWTYKRLDELGFVGRGKSKHRPRNDPSLYGGPYPFVQTGDVKAANLYISEYTQTYNDNGLSQSKLWEPDTLLITIAANIAETAILKIRACFPDSIVGFVADPHKADVRFVKYSIDTMKLHMQAISRGTTQDNLSVDKLLTFRFPIPLLPIQRKIASILSAYDDLIENNTRRIKILEEMARLIYREWFVNFRFPGYEKVKMVDSELGKIPERWELKSLQDVTENFDRLRRPLSSMERADRKGPYPYYGAAKVFDHIDAYIFDGVYLLVAEDGSVITRERRPVLQYVSVKFWANNHTHIIKGKGMVSTEYLYLVLDNLDISGYVTGAAQPKITQTNLSRIPVFKADDELHSKFNEIISTIFRKRVVLVQRNENLCSTRDLLLPKLISGEIDLENLDIRVPAEAVEVAVPAL